MYYGFLKAVLRGKLCLPTVFVGKRHLPNLFMFSYRSNYCDRFTKSGVCCYSKARMSTIGFLRCFNGSDGCLNIL